MRARQWWTAATRRLSSSARASEGAWEKAPTYSDAGSGAGAGRERFAAARCTARETAYVPAGRVRFPLEEPAASSPGTEPEAPRPPPPPAPRLGLGELSPVATHSARTNASTRVGSLMRKSYRRPDRSSRARLAHRGVRSRGASELPRIPTHRGETLTTTNIRLRRVNRAGGGRTSDARAVGQMSGCQFPACHNRSRVEMVDLVETARGHFGADTMPPAGLSTSGRRTLPAPPSAYSPPRVSKMTRSGVSGRGPEPVVSEVLRPVPQGFVQEKRYEVPAARARYSKAAIPPPAPPSPAPPARTRATTPPPRRASRSSARGKTCVIDRPVPPPTPPPLAPLLDRLTQRPLSSPPRPLPPPSSQMLLSRV